MALRLYLPTVSTEQLIPGIDNIRFDVSLSPKFVTFCQGLVLQLLVKHSEAGQLLQSSPGAPKPSAKKEFREMLQDLLVTVLNCANTEKKPQLEVLAQAAIFKLLLLEIQRQYSAAIEQGREKMKIYQRPGQESNPRGFQLQAAIADFQAFRRIIRSEERRVGKECRL